MTLTFIWLKELNLFLSMSQRIELFSEWLKDFVENDSKNQTFFWIWPKESNFFLLKICSKNCFSVWFTELNFFQHYLKNGTFEYDSKSWTFFDMTPIIEPWKIQRTDFPNSKNWTFEKHDSNFSDMSFFEKIQRIEPFFSNITQSIESFSRRWLKELNPSYKTHRLENFFTWLKDFNLLNMTQGIEPLLYMTQRIEPFWGIWLNGLNPLHERTQRIGHQKIIWLQQPNLFVYDLGNWAFFFSCWLKELNFFSKLSLKNYWPFWTWLTELNSVLEHDSPNWTFFLKNMTHRNWTLLFNMSQRKWLHF